MAETTVHQEDYLKVLDESVDLVESCGVPYAIIGGIASLAVGRPRRVSQSEDVDFLVRPDEADLVLLAFREAGYRTEHHAESWIYKARKNGILVDVIFRSSGDMYLDDEMIERTQVVTYENRRLRVISSEDLLVMKAVAHSEDTPQYWHDAVGLVAQGDLDWEYLTRRAQRHGPRRVLSLLLYASSNDLVVPPSAVETLYEMVRAS